MEKSVKKGKKVMRKSSLSLSPFYRLWEWFV